MHIELQCSMKIKHIFCPAISKVQNINQLFTLNCGINGNTSPP